MSPAVPDIPSLLYCEEVGGLSHARFERPAAFFILAQSVSHCVAVRLEVQRPMGESASGVLHVVKVREAVVVGDYGKVCPCEVVAEVPDAIDVCEAHLLDGRVVAFSR